MTLPRKYTRPLTVDDVRYRWMLKETDHGAWFELLLVVEATDVVNGEQLVAHLEWKDRQPADDAVTPAVVAALIKSARAAGWSPERPGSCPACNDTFRSLVRASHRSEKGA